MISFKKINLNRPHCFFSYIKNGNPNLLSIGKISCKNTAVVYNQNINSENPLGLSFSDVDAYIIDETGNKCLIFALTKKNREVLGQCQKLWSEFKKQIKAINGGKSIKYKTDFMKIRFDSNDDDLPLNKLLSLSVLI